MGDYGLGGPGVCTYPNSADTDQCYYNSPTFDIPALKAFTDKYLGTALMPLDAGTTLANDTLSDFNLSEDVAAGYAMAHLKFGPLTVTPGIRYEHTKLDITGYELDGSDVMPTSRSHDYGDWLPSVLVKITPTDTTVFRLAYSKSLGRPEYADLSPGGSIDSEDDSASFGNPDLKPYRADNLDATAEWYFARGGLLSVGVFAKFIKNPIFTQATVLTNVTLNGTTYDRLDVSEPLNADKGDIVGIEAEYQQQFTFLPGLLSGFGVQLTGTLTDSNLRLPDGRTSTFPSQSKYLYGAELFYQKGRVEASIAYHNTGHALLAIGDPAYNDQYNDDLRPARRQGERADHQERPRVRRGAEPDRRADAAISGRHRQLDDPERALWTDLLRRRVGEVLMDAVLTLIALFASGAAPAETPPAAPPLAPAAVIARFTAAEAHQGVAVDDRSFYAIDNSAIGKYDKHTGRRTAHWQGDPRLYPHINSCVVEQARLICAASNHPDVPMASSVEIFDTATLHHVRSIALPPYSGSLTWIERHQDSWFALFANYDQGHGGEPGHDHRWTLLMRLDDQFRAVQSWHFPEDVLERFAPMSCSGGSWAPDGLLYVTGHTRGELYAMRLPDAGTVLEHVATIPLPTGGQAFTWDGRAQRVVWSIDRQTHMVVESRVPMVPADDRFLSGCHQADI